MSDENENKATEKEIDEKDDFEFGGKKSGEQAGNDDGGDGTGNEENAGEKGKGISGKESSEDNSGEQGNQGAENGEGANGEEKDDKKDEGGAEGSKKEDGEGDESGQANKDEGADGEKGKGAADDQDGGGKGEGTKKEGDDGTDVDFFGEGYKDEGKSKDSFDVKGFASEFEIDTEDPKELKKQINEKIENAKQDFKLDGYSADAQGIIRHLNENEGKLDDFFKNKNIASLQGVIGLNDEQKVLYVRTNELIKTGLDKDKASEQALEETEEFGTRELKDMASRIDDDANTLITEEIDKIIGDRNKIASQQTEKAETKKKGEVGSLKDYVNAQDNFMGIELTPKAKQNIVRDIETGVFDETANKNPIDSKYSAYMFAKFGKKIVEKYSNNASEQNRKGHNEALDKQTSALHKTKAGAQSKGVGKQDGQNKGGKNFDSWADGSMFGEDA